MVLSTRQGEFLSAYTQMLNAYVERYKQLEDPLDPIDLFFTRNFDYERMDEMGEEWEQDIKEIKRCNSLWRDAMTWIDYANNEAEKVMKEYFKTAGYDYEHIPPAPRIDHETPKKLKDYVQTLPARSYDGETTKLHKTAIQVGQLIIVSETWHGDKSYTVFVDTTGLSFPFRLSCGGTKECKAAFHEKVLRLASEWSKLTDWSQFVAIPLKVKRALGERAKELYQEVMKEYLG